MHTHTAHMLLLFTTSSHPCLVGLQNLASVPLGTMYGDYRLRRDLVAQGTQGYS